MFSNLLSGYLSDAIIFQYENRERILVFKLGGGETPLPPKQKEIETPAPPVIDLQAESNEMSSAF